MIWAWVSQAWRGNLNFGARGLKSGPAQAGASVAAAGCLLTGFEMLTGFETVIGFETRDM